MGINKCVLFIDTPVGPFEAETTTENEFPGIKVTLRDNETEPEIRVQYNPEERDVEVLLVGKNGEKTTLLHTIMEE